MAVDFSRRATEPEQMDALDLPAVRYEAVLHDLARVNVATRAAAPTLRWLAAATRGMPHCTILDVGFGHGDMLRRIAHWARRRHLPVTLVGADINPRSAPIAAAATDPSLGITWQTGDAAALDLRPDLIISSLVAHHLTDTELVGFLRWMEDTARCGWLINDLHRHPLAWVGFRALARLMAVDPIVRHDGALSVRRAFRRSDWADRLAAAGVPRETVTIRWSLPFRWAVGRVRSPMGPRA